VLLEGDAVTGDAMNVRGLGDRWVAGETLPGVAYAFGDPVEVVDGARAGARGTIALLLAVSPEPRYLVALGGGGDARVRQSGLRRATRGGTGET
jgi:hypothetical protein